jgi:hypothetical protein
MSTGLRIFLYPFNSVEFRRSEQAAGVLAADERFIRIESAALYFLHINFNILAGC